MKNGENGAAQRLSERVELGQYIVVDPEICHGKPTFKGTRIMVWQVLDDVVEGRSWEFICGTRWDGRVSLAAVGEAVKLSRQSWLDKRGGLSRIPFSKRAALIPALKKKLGKSAAVFKARLNRISRKPIHGASEVLSRLRR
jgi:hypothetical protein